MFILVTMIYASIMLYVFFRGVVYLYRSIDAHKKALNLIDQKHAKNIPFFTGVLSEKENSTLENESPQALFYVKAYNEYQKKAALWLLPSWVISAILFFSPIRHYLFQ